MKACSGLRKREGRREKKACDLVKADTSAIS
jgi:hypothetical protein